jgi:hypothetical protein
MVETNITNMPESGLIVLSVCSIILAAALLVPVMLAGRAPRHKGPAATPWTGPVRGGIHQGDGRGVAPHRDAPAEVHDQEKVAQVTRERGTGTEERQPGD